MNNKRNEFKERIEFKKGMKVIALTAMMALGGMTLNL